MIRKLAPILIAAAVLAGCDGRQGTSITINSSDGNTVAGMDGNSGEMAINVPGFAGRIKLPKIRMNADNFDLNGVHLYPGSTIGGMNVDAHDDAKTGKDSGTVRISFDSPAAPARVRDWFADKLSRDAGYKVKASGDGLIGTTEEGKPFRLDLTPDGADKSKGVIVLSGS